jgi:hypothetical protein
LTWRVSFRKKESLPEISKASVEERRGAAFQLASIDFFTLARPPSCIWIRQSGQTSFLNTLPTFFFGQFSHQIFLQVGHCHRGGLRNPPISFLHLEQKPLTMGFRSVQQVISVREEAMPERAFELATASEIGATGMPSHQERR